MSTSQGVSRPSMAIPVENDEMFTVRDAMRKLNLIVDGLRGGVVLRKAVLMKHNKMVAVVLSVDEYRNSLAGQHETSDLRRGYEECVCDLAACKTFKQIEEVERAFSDADAAARAFAAVLDEFDGIDLPNEFRWKAESVLAEHPGFGGLA